MMRSISVKTWTLLYIYEHFMFIKLESLSSEYHAFYLLMLCVAESCGYFITLIHVLFSP